MEREYCSRYKKTKITEVQNYTEEINAFQFRHILKAELSGPVLFTRKNIDP